MLAERRRKNQDYTMEMAWKCSPNDWWGNIQASSSLEAKSEEKSRQNKYHLATHIHTQNKSEQPARRRREVLSRGQGGVEKFFPQTYGPHEAQSIRLFSKNLIECLYIEVSSVFYETVYDYKNYKVIFWLC